MKANDPRRVMSESERFELARTIHARLGPSWRKRRMREATQDLVDDALDDGLEVKRRLWIRCSACTHQATIKAPAGRRLRCSRCGNDDPVVRSR